ncbi:hypothetical protein [Halomontanus rarus]|uniref:hypothetical protein n=1 Tax=Halomontanus rarus TaxID=3034020 RepID=UPI0023E8B666|nr:hypothetical protein [Halovivax sp. TS33]
MEEKDQNKVALWSPDRRKFLAVCGSVAAALPVNTVSSKSNSCDDAVTPTGSDDQLSLESEYKITTTYYGPEDARQNIEPNKGVKYVSVDKGWEYYGTGEEWVTRNYAAESISAVEQQIGDPPRDIMTNDTVVVTVPTDYDTVQAALDDIPLHVRHDYTIEIEPPYEADEDLLLRPVIARGQAESVSGEQAFVSGRVQIRSTDHLHTPDPSNITLNSFAASSVVGVDVRIRDINFDGKTPYSHDETSCVAYSCNEVLFQNLSWNYSGVGVHVYNGSADVRKCDFSNLRSGIWAKREATVNAHDNTGTTTEEPYRSTGGATLSVYNDETGNEPAQTFHAGYGGMAYMADTPRMAVMGVGPAQDQKPVSMMCLNAYLRDDFGDSDPVDREKQRWGAYPPISESNARFRPTWGIGDGEISISNGVMVIPNRNRATTNTHATEAVWKMDFAAADSPSTSEFQLYIIQEDSNNWIRVAFDEDGTLRLQKRNNGSVTTLGTDLWERDDERHTVEVKRERTLTGPEITVIYDGATVITANDPYLPEVRNIRIQNFWDVNARIHSFKVY